ncbi:MAG: transcription antitermination factor NusB [Bdellovibrionales bacterium CG12_big_fil_rev_8_21_14_0_65_38_15]|nr:MAG: transcription antitermination factor NusB [Bdellovibrionales bacterium CG22_combo_CG10-13_8_21_14_all_38_13]PIQ53517.1 MAG: transcription antitermination factor NusB [Bdellovibrionales bacterium CG12_big_fil_rev_8_21_14_0_65_38_15]PIR28479.1 MAG: transcription antitermination factor NusB [Bdellovibrionales bacterium CG11_big_fil_rev_8_21_14_0_20_38_13]
MAKGHIQKTLARKYAFKFLYPKSLANYEASPAEADTKAELDEFDESYIAPDEEHEDNELSLESKTFGRKLILSAFSSFDQILSDLNPCLAPRTLDKLDMLERTIVILGACELKTQHDTPAAIVINEYVEMAKEYGNQKSYTFVNGVLDKFAKATR